MAKKTAAPAKDPMLDVQIDLSLNSIMNDLSDSKKDTLTFDTRGYGWRPAGTRIRKVIGKAMNDLKMLRKAVGAIKADYKKKTEAEKEKER
jgi:hypothetical protein